MKFNFADQGKWSSWHYFPLFLIITLLTALLVLYLIYPALFTGNEAKKIPLRDIKKNGNRQERVPGEEVEPVDVHFEDSRVIF